MGTIKRHRIHVFQSQHNSDLYTNCLEEWCPHQHILYVATTESPVVCFVVHGLILPIYNGRETAVPPCPPARMLISPRTLVKSPVARPTNAIQLTGSIQVRPDASWLFKKDAIN